MAVLGPPAGKVFLGARSKPRGTEGENATGTNTSSAILAFENLLGRYPTKFVDVDHRYLGGGDSTAKVKFTAAISSIPGGSTVADAIANRDVLLALGQRSANIWYEVASSTTHDANIVAQILDARAFFGAAPIAITWWHEPANYDNTTSNGLGLSPANTSFGAPGDAVHSVAAGGWFKKAFAKVCWLTHLYYPEACVVLCLQAFNFNVGTNAYNYIDNWYPGDTIPGSGITWRAADTSSLGLNPAGAPTHDVIGADGYQTFAGDKGAAQIDTPDKIYGRFYHWSTGVNPTGAFVAPTVKSGRKDYPLWIPEFGCEPFTSTTAPKTKAEWFTWLGDWLEGKGVYAGKGHPAIQAMVYFHSSGAASEGGDKGWWIDGLDHSDTASLNSFKAFAQRAIFDTSLVAPPPPPKTPWEINSWVGAAG